MEKYLKLQPTKGKYVKISSNGTTYEIFMVDPRTNERGTRVARMEAIELLELYPQLITLVQQVKDGKIVKQISDEEVAQVRQNQFNRKLGLFSENSEERETSSVENNELKKLIQSQSKLIEEQAKAIKTLQNQMAKISGKEEKEETKEKDAKSFGFFNKKKEEEVKE